MKPKSSTKSTKEASLAKSRDESIARFLGRRDYELSQILAERDRKIAALQFTLDQALLKLECLRARSVQMAEFLSMLKKKGIAEFPQSSFSWDSLPAGMQRLKDDSILFELVQPGYELSLGVDLGRCQGFHSYPLIPSLRKLCGILLFPIVEVPTCGGSILLEIVAPDGQVKAWAKRPIEEVLPETPVRFSFPPLDIVGNAGWQLQVSASECPAGLYLLEFNKGGDRLPFCGFVFEDEKACADQTLNVEGYLLANLPASPQKRAVIFGAGEGGRRVMSILSSYGWAVQYFVDNRREAWGTKLSGIEIRDPQSLLERDYDVILIASRPGQRAITDQLQKMGLVFGADFLVAGV